ncbi:MAG: sulfur carrier protein ThiS [Pelagibacteraceae bacterium]|jgi:sulfur carrier protein|tara:strand:- start:188 stop:391 length:204 start_codon:yes stop_codon:yes gene_type:complete
MAKIQLNGKNIILKEKLTLFDLIQKYKLNLKKVAIELNGKIIIKKKFKSTKIKERDKIEIVHFIGGG